MQIDSIEDRLVSLQDALARLRSYPVTVEARRALQDAIAHTEDLVKMLVPGDGRNRLAALYQVSRVLGTSLDMDEVLNQVMDAVIELTGAERGFLMLVDPDTGELKLRAARNIERETLERKDMEVSRTVIHKVLADGEGVLSTDAQQDPRFSAQESVVLFALKSLLCAPLRARGQVIGVIYVENRAQSGIFEKEDLDLLSAFATQAAIAIENARLYTRTDQALTARVAELERLTQIDRELNAQLDFDRVVETTCKWAVAGTGATHCWILLFDEDGSPQYITAPGSGEGIPLDGWPKEAVDRTLAEDSPLSFQPQGDMPARLIAPMRTAGKIIGVLGVESAAPFSATDLEFLERLAGRAVAALENARFYEAVQEANQAKTKFISVVTHELRIPMTSIKGYTDLLRQGAVGQVNDTQLNFLNVIRNNVERMSALVSDLSDISHIETGRMRFNLEFVSVKECLDETLNNLGPRIKEKNQTLEIDTSEKVSNVCADPIRLIQILTNLVSNAWKYTPSGGHINIRVRSNGEFVKVEVEDNGVGISPEDQTQLFTQFFRSEEEEVREQQGWGLGLNVTKRLVEMMGGEIGAESTLGEGSTFWFMLPTVMQEQSEQGE